MSLIRTASGKYRKQYMDKIFHQAIYQIPRVNLIKLTEDEITRNVSGKKSKIFKDGSLENKNQFEPAEKKQKMDESGEKFLKSVVPRDVETDTLKTRYQSIGDDEKNIKDLKDDNNSSIELGEIVCDNPSKVKKSTNISKTGNIGCHNIKNSSEDNNISIETKEIQYDNTLENQKSKSSPKLGKIKCCSIDKIMNPSKIETYLKHFELTHINYKPTKNDENISSVTNSRSSNAQISVQTQCLSLSDIERLYHKYFTRSVHDHIVIIANILNIIATSNKHHISRLNETFKKKTQAEKFIDGRDANKIHLRHKAILESKLKKYFMEVIIKFEYSEFEPAFQLFFLCLSKVLEVLDVSKFIKDSIFKNVLRLLLNSLKNCEREHDKVLGMFRKETFGSDCSKLDSLIKNSQFYDRSITDRMSLFFVSPLTCQEYFEIANNSVINYSDVDLALLIDNAASQCCINSMFKVASNSPCTSVIKNNVTVIKNAPKTPIASTSKSNDSFQARTPDESFQSTSTKASRDDVSHSLARQLSVIVDPIKSTVQIPNIPFQTRKMGVTIKPPVQNIKSFSTYHISRHEEKIIVIGNKKYTLIGGQILDKKTVTSQNGVERISKMTVVLCYNEKCEKDAKLLCGGCKSVTYCSKHCQKIDWYARHIKNCKVTA